MGLVVFGFAPFLFDFFPEDSRSLLRTALAYVGPFDLLYFLFVKWARADMAGGLDLVAGGDLYIFRRQLPVLRSPLPHIDSNKINKGYVEENLN